MSVYARTPSLIEEYSIMCGPDEYLLTKVADQSVVWASDQELLRSASDDIPFLLSTSVPGCRIGKNHSKSWMLEDEDTYYLEYPPASASVAAIHTGEAGGKAKLIGDCDYVASGYFAAHRSRGRLLVEVFDADDGLLASYEHPIDPHFKGGPKLSGYQLIELRFQAPSRASSCTFSVECIDSLGDESKSKNYLFFAHCSLTLNESGALRPTEILRGDKRTVQRLNARGCLYVATTCIDVARLNQTRSSIRLEPRFTRPGAKPWVLYTLPDLATRSPRIGVLKANTLEFATDGVIDAADLIIDGQRVDRRPCDPAGRIQFTMPARYYDGEIHHIQIKDRYGLAVLAEDFQAFPRTLTPWQLLRTGNALPAVCQLGPADGLRYKGLLRHLEDVGNGNESSWVLQNLGRLHQTLEGGFETLTQFEPLVFPEHESPDVSIVIPVHNSFNVTYFCLCALLFAKNRASFEVIVVDDASNDSTQRLPEIVKGVVYLRNETNQGFVRSCNRGAERARGRYVLMLNNDTEPTVGWLDELIHATNLYPNVGLAGSRLLYPNGALQEAGGIVWSNGDPWNYGRNANPADPRFGYTRQVDYLSGAAIMLPLVIWKLVGGFSEEFCPAYFEDTDLAFKVREAGFKTVYAAQSIVYHFEGISSGTSVSSGTKRYQEINRPKFKRKWSRAYRAHSSPGTEPDLEKDRGIRGRALFVDHRTPRPDFDAGSYALIQEMRLVQALGFKVSFLPQQLEYFGKYTDDLNRLGIETIYAPFYFSLDEVLERRGHEFDVAYVTRYTVAQRVVPLLRRRAPQAKILFCNADLHFLRELRLAIAQNDAASLNAALKTRDDELGIMREVDVTLSYNEVEHAVITSHNLNSTTVVKAPWVVEVANAVAPFEERADIAFLGGFGHPPNIDAVEYFVAEVMPRLRRSLPGVRFHVYGSTLPERLRRLECEDVRCPGYAKSLSDVFARHRVFVAPLLTGAGIKGKVLAAMASGIPTVLSSIAAEGIHVRDGYDCLIARTPEEWVTSIKQIYEQGEVWNKISNAGRDFMRTEYSFQKGLRTMRDAFEAVGIYVDADLTAHGET